MLFLHGKVGQTLLISKTNRGKVIICQEQAHAVMTGMVCALFITAGELSIRLLIFTYCVTAHPTRNFS